MCWVIFWCYCTSRHGKSPYWNQFRILLSVQRKEKWQTDRQIDDYVTNHMMQRGRVLEKPTVLQLAKSSMNFWDLKIHYHGHNIPMLSQMKPVHTVRSYLRAILILSPLLYLGLPQGLLPSGVCHQNPAYISLSHACTIPRPDLITLLVRRCK